MTSIIHPPVASRWTISILFVFGVLTITPYIITATSGIKSSFPNSPSNLKMTLAEANFEYSKTGSGTVLCSIHNLRFALSQVAELLSNRSLSVLSWAGTWNDVFLGELESAVVFVADDKATVVVVSSKDQMFVNHNRCLPIARANIVMNVSKEYTDLVVEEVP